MNTIPRNALDLAAAGVRLLDADVQPLLARLDLFRESVVLTHYDEGNPVRCYEVDPEDLAAAFSGIPLSTGILPPDCLFYTRRNGEVYIGIYVPPQQVTLTVARTAGTVQYHIPLPGLVFGGRGLGYFVYAVKARPLPGQTHWGLYRAPLPNVSADSNGSICRGNVAFPECQAQTIHDALRQFLESNFNEHLVHGKSKENPDDILSLWDELEGQETYPLDDLVYARHRGPKDLVEGVL